MTPPFLSRIPGIPVNHHPGAFGFRRKHHIHEGIDLYTDSDTPVYAIRSGVVVRVFPFTGPKADPCVEGSHWLDTDAVVVGDEDGYFLYGEVSTHLKTGNTVSEGDLIGRVKPVVTKLRTDVVGHSCSMLHLERYSLETADFGLSWYDDRPKGLLDPTPIIVGLYPSVQILCG